MEFIVDLGKGGETEGVERRIGTGDTDAGGEGFGEGGVKF